MHDAGRSWEEVTVSSYSGVGLFSSVLGLFSYCALVVFKSLSVRLGVLYTVKVGLEIMTVLGVLRIYTTRLCLIIS